MYVSKESLEERGLSEDDLMPLMYEDEDDDWAEKPSIKVMTNAEIKDIMSQQDVVLSF
jgi:tRNA 2-thiouridine synthesizing protein C